MRTYRDKFPKNHRAKVGKIGEKTVVSILFFHNINVIIIKMLSIYLIIYFYISIFYIPQHYLSLLIIHNLLNFFQ